MAETERIKHALSHPWVTDVIRSRDVDLVQEHLSKYKNIRYFVIGSNHFSDDIPFKLTKDGTWYGTCVDGNPYMTESFFRFTYPFRDRVQFIFSYIVPPRYASTQKLIISQKHSGKATLIKARKKDIEDADEDIWVKCMTTTELIDIVGTDFKLLQIDTEGLDWAILKSFPNELYKNLDHIILETVRPDLVTRLYEAGLNKVYYVDDIKYGQYWYFARKVISKKLFDKYKLRNDNKLRNNSML